MIHKAAQINPRKFPRPKLPRQRAGLAYQRLVARAFATSAPSGIMVQPDAWFSYEVDVRDDVWRGKPVTKIKISVNGTELYEYLDFARTFKDGYFAFQQHDPGSHVSIRKVEVIELPAQPR